MRPFICVDGFNFYHRAIRNPSWKWLDFMALFKDVLKGDYNIECIKYFTARVSDTVDNPSKSQHQDAYFRALKHHIPQFEIYFGHFLSNSIRRPLVSNPKQFVDILNTSEKGSDVNLAVHLLNDAWLNRYECSVVVSNDSDLAEAMRLTKVHCKKRIGLITPGRSHSSKQLFSQADFTLHIHSSQFHKCQLPNPIPGANIHKPLTW